MTVAELAVAEAEVEALEWDINVGGGQVAAFAVVLLACLALVATVTYVIEEVRHDGDRHEHRSHK